MTWHDAAALEELPPGTEDRRLLEIGGRRIALFRASGKLYAVENHCPHRQGPVGAGPLEGTTLTCPWHGLRFDLSSGRCLSGEAPGLTRYEVQVRDERILVKLEDSNASSGSAVLVRYALPGWLSLFSCGSHIKGLQRGDRVVVQCSLGPVRGEVMGVEAGQGRARPLAGTVVDRLADPEGQGLDPLLLEKLLAAAQERITAAGTAVQVMGAEELVDESAVILYFLGAPTERLGPVAASLAEVVAGRRVQFHPWEAPDPGRPAARGAPEVKGPYERFKYDFTRLWECPDCGRKDRTGGQVTSQLCPCSSSSTSPGTVMRLLSDHGVVLAVGKTDRDTEPMPSPPEPQTEAGKDEGPPPAGSQGTPS